MIVLRRIRYRCTHLMAALTPCALFLALVASGAALFPSARAGSLPLVVGCLAALATSLCLLVAWVLTSERRDSTAAQADDDWPAFEQAFRAYVDSLGHRSSPRPRGRRGSC
jgi:hypothetical protein